MSATTVDLSRLSPDSLQNLLHLKYSYDENRKSRVYVHKQYQKQKKLATEHLNRLFRDFYATFINQVDEFVTNSMDLNGESLFPNMHSNLINGATLVLGLHTSDHKAILDLIEQHVQDNFDDIKTYRLGSDYVKRAHFIDLVQDVRGYTNVLIIIEHLETIDRFLLKMFITILHDLLVETDLNRVMVLFGLSNNWEEFGSILPLGALNRIKMRRTIVRDSRDDVSTMIQEKLLNIDHFDTRLGPDLLNFIYSTVLERDTSMANLSYLFQFCLLQNSLRSKAVLRLPKKQLIEMLKSEPDLITQVKKFKSLTATTSNNLGSSPEKVASFIIQSVEDVKRYFKYLWSQIHCYFQMLKDETRTVFPSEVSDIYEEVMTNQTLGDSKQLIDAILKFSKYPTDRLVKRLDLCCSDVTTLNGSLPKSDIRLKLMLHKNRIINNDEDEKFRDKLREDLFSHARSLINPSRVPLSELVYFDNIKSVMHRTLPSTRLEARKSYIDNSSCFGVLYGLIHNGPEEMVLADLCGDFVSALDEHQILKPKSTGVKFKTTAKRHSSLRSSVIKQMNTTSSIQTSNDIGLKKAIFNDLILCLVYQGLIIKDTKQSKRGTIRRCVWL